MKKKILALCLVVVLAATAVIGGTLAYFTDTDDVTNTFAVGNVGLDVWEERNGAATDDGFEYENMMPGVPYEKDAFVKMDDNSQPAYLFVELEFTNAHNLWAAINATYPEVDNPTAKIADYMLVNPEANLKNENIVAYKYSEENGATYSVVYKYGVKTAGTTINLFDAIQIPAEMNNENAAKLNGTTLTVKAHAIQEAGLTEAEAINTLLYANGYRDIAKLQ